MNLSDSLEEKLRKPIKIDKGTLAGRYEHDGIVSYYDVRSGYDNPTGRASIHIVGKNLLLMDYSFMKFYFMWNWSNIMGIIGKRFEFEGENFEVKNVDKTFFYASKVVNGKPRVGRPKFFKIVENKNIFAELTEEAKSDFSENITVFEETFDEVSADTSDAVSSLVDEFGNG